MSNPLVSRPPYGEGKPRTPIAVAELPGGGPSDRGLPVDPGIPGSSTFTKPVDDVRKPNNDDESIYRVDGPDDLTKDRDRIDVNEDSKDQNTSFPGLGKPEPANKTKYPYRDEKPNAHNAAFVAELWKLAGAHNKVLSGSTQVKVATTRDEILSGLDGQFQQKARRCAASLKRADIKNLRWIFSVNCGNGPKAVKIRALPKGMNRQFAKLDLELSCSCPAWQWLGPEYHAKQESYQLGPFAGTASTPDIRDPERDNRVCKHVAAALSLTRTWEIPKSKIQRAVKKAMQVRKAVEKALEKRACNVCTATNVLNAGTDGWRREWKATKSETSVVAYVRARGSAEGAAKYQIRKEGQGWPSEWVPTRDLAGALGRLGFDRGWPFVPPKFRAWLQKG